MNFGKSMVNNTLIQCDVSLTIISQFGEPILKNTVFSYLRYLRISRIDTKSILSSFQTETNMEMYKSV